MAVNLKTLRGAPPGGVSIACAVALGGGLLAVILEILKLHDHSWEVRR